MRLIDLDKTIERFKMLHGNRNELLSCYSYSDIIDMLESQPEIEEAKEELE